MTSKIVQAINQFSFDNDRRQALINEFRRTKEKQVDERIRICKELSGMFEFRSEWQRKHCTSYNWASQNGVIERKIGSGIKNGKPALFAKKSELLEIAKARTELHKYAVQNKFGYKVEQFAGAVLKRQIELGNTIPASLELAKAALQTYVDQLAKARDDLHKFAKAGDYGYSLEYFAGEVLKQQIHAGNTIEASLELAKVALQTGMAEVKAAA